MDCADYIITANFEENRPLAYPLRRAYEMIEVAATPALEDVDVSQATGDDRTFGQYESNDGTVNINFYPYNSEVYYETRESFTGAQDVDVYVYGADPGWYDPWYSGWYYYPTTRVSFYWGWPSWGWGFGWGYWGGYYCSAWYWPRCYRVYDSWCYDYCYYDGGYRYRPERYKDKYKGGGGIDGGRTGYKDKYATTSTAYRTAYAQAAKRDGRMKLASGNVRTTTKSGYTRTKTASAYPTVKDRGGYRSLSKTTRVRNFGTKRSASTKYAYAQKSRKYTPRTRSSYGVNSKGTNARTRGTGTTTLKPRTPRSGSYKSPAYKSGKSRTTSRSAYKRSPASRSHVTPKSRTSGKRYSTSPRKSSSKATYKSGPSSSKRRSSSKSKYKAPSRSNRPSGRSSSVKSSRSAPRKSSGKSSGSRSSGGRSKSGGKSRR
jgi:hypothetical protein